MSEATERYLNNQKDMTPEEKEFFLKQKLLWGSIDIEAMTDFLKKTVTNWKELTELQKLKHFLKLWTIEAELTYVMEEEKNGSNISPLYRKGRTKAIADTEEIIRKLENKWI